MNEIVYYAAAISSLVSFGLVRSGSAEHRPNESGRDGIERIRIRPSRQNPRNSEGAFIRLEDGRILLVYTHFTTGTADDSGAWLAGRSSDDDGKTWSEDEMLVVPNEGENNVMSVSLLRLTNGTIPLFYLRKNSLSDCLPFMRISTDEARTWSEPTRIIAEAEAGYYVLNNDRVIQLSNGRLVAPVAMHNSPQQDEFDYSGVIMCHLSDDLGKSWRRSTSPASSNSRMVA